MFYPRVVAIRSNKCVMNRCNVAISVNSTLDTDVELPETQSRESCTLEVMT